jgi:hypothetical protein
MLAVTDIVFVGDIVVTDRFETATPSNTRPWRKNGDCSSRCSAVWYSMASMVQTSETGFNTLKEAKLAGHHCQSGYDIPDLFQKASDVLS